MGLSMVHIRPQVGGRVSTARGAQWSKITPTLDGPRTQPIQLQGTRRGLIEEFSTHSRSRLIQRISQVPRASAKRGVLVLTLTYPAVWPEDPARWKRDLKAFNQRVRREVPDAAWFWKMEPQRRGAPHFHLLMFGCKYLAKDWLKRAWYECVGSGDEKHLRAGTQVARPKYATACAKYASKYAAKSIDSDAISWEWPGRWWGVVNRKGLLLELVDAELEPDLFRIVHNHFTRQKLESRQTARDACWLSCPIRPWWWGTGGWWRISDVDIYEICYAYWREHPAEHQELDA